MHTKHRLAVLGSTLLFSALLLTLLAACDDKGTGLDNPYITADTAETNVTWSSSATQYRGQNNMRVAYACPDSGMAGTIWGTNTYTDDSSVCTAAVHAGKISLSKGGRVVIEIRPGDSVYVESTRNGITSHDYTSWGGSYIFP